MRDDFIGVAGLTLLLCSTLMSIVLSPFTFLSASSDIFLALIGWQSPLWVYAGFLGSRWWWLVTLLGLPCSYLWLLS